MIAVQFIMPNVLDSIRTPVKNGIPKFKADDNPHNLQYIYIYIFIIKDIKG